MIKYCCNHVQQHGWKRLLGGSPSLCGTKSDHHNLKRYNGDTGLDECVVVETGKLGDASHPKLKEALYTALKAGSATNHKTIKTFLLSNIATK